MHIYLTGATGFIGSRILPLLLDAGHRVTGLTRSGEGARQIEAAGATAYRGTLEDPAGLARGAENADAVIHTAFDHNFANFVENTQKDYRVIEALGEVLSGTARPLIITSGVGIGSRGSGAIATEDFTDWDNPNPRIATEKAGQALLDRGVSVGVVRLPQVHNIERAGLISPLTDIFVAQGAAGYGGDGSARWSAAHVDDVAQLYVLALENHRAGIKWNAVDEEGVASKDIAAVLAGGLGLPLRAVPDDELGQFFGWMAAFATHDMAASSEWTRRTLGWNPKGPKLLDDLRAMFERSPAG